jgi:TonB family protein
MGIQVNDLTNNFNHSLLKKRITMMTKSKSNYFAKLKVLLVTPVAFFLVVAFTVSPVVKTVAQVDKQTQKVEVKSQSPQDGDQNELFTVVENMPKFPGGEEARAKFFAENIKYPEAARKAGVQGTCYVTFVIEEDGSTSNVKVLRGIGGGCDEEAVRVIQSMPKWEPGTQRGKAVRVQFNMPVKFSLGEGKKEDAKSGTPPPPPPSQQPDKK